MRLSRFSALLLPAFFASGIARADSVVTLDVNVRNAPTPTPLEIPQTGTYTLSFKGQKASILSPDGTIKVIDSEAKIVSFLDPTHKTFYQMPIDAFLTYGDKLPPQLSGSSARSTVTFETIQGQEARQLLGHTANPYTLDLEAHVTKKSSGTGRGGGRRRGGIFGAIGGGGGGGGSYPSGSSDGSGAPQAASAGTKVSGEMWLTDSTPPDVDPDQLALAEVAVMMPFSPGLKELVTRVHRGKTTILAASFAISTLDRNGQDPTDPPNVIAEMKSLVTSTVEDAVFRIPADFAKISPPPSPLGSGN